MPAPSDGHDSAMLARRRQFRREATPAERILWRELRARQVAGAKVRRQYQCGPYILDFYVPSRRLAIEADGESHATAEGQARDAARTAYLAERGIGVLRFTNREIMVAPDGVLARIDAALGEPASSGPVQPGVGSHP